MREILFKAKRIDNGEWVEGSYLHCPKATTVSFEKEHYILWFDGYGIVWYAIDRDTICQFTGLYDSTKWEDLSEKEQRAFLDEGNLPHEWKGKKIWENDVVVFKHEKFDFDDGLEPWERTCLPNKKEYKRNYVVEFCNTPTHYGLRFRNGSIWFMVHRMTIVMHDVEVIGNIFDNPELLKGEQP